MESRNTKRRGPQLGNRKDTPPPTSNTARLFQNKTERFISKTVDSFPRAGTEERGNVVFSTMTNSFMCLLISYVETSLRIRWENIVQWLTLDDIYNRVLFLIQPG